MNDDKKILHVYGQEYHHDDVCIIGTRAALEELRTAISNALYEPFGSADASVNDGEAYTVLVLLVDDATADALPVPYTSDVCKERDMSRTGFFESLIRERIKMHRSVNLGVNHGND